MTKHFIVGQRRVIMRLVVIIVLAYAAVTSAQLGIVGSKVGSKVGADIGLLTGTVLDTMPSMIGIGASKPDPPRRRGPPRGGGPPRAAGSDREQTVQEWDGSPSGRPDERERLRGGRRPNYN